MRYCFWCGAAASGCIEVQAKSTRFEARVPCCGQCQPAAIGKATEGFGEGYAVGRCRPLTRRALGVTPAG